MSPGKKATAPGLGIATSSFAVSAAVAILFNTLLAWAKDMWAGLNDWMKSLTGHHWTTHGLADLAIFVGLGLILMKTRATEKMSPERTILLLAGSVVLAMLGLVLWFAFI